ncbi:MAG: transglycosylase SLT domain-containing protein [Acetobacteraceae bacterium]|nr:transglycosylase SLT domain-containing protein [Acetobacteraceae bacterium]
MVAMCLWTATAHAIPVQAEGTDEQGLLCRHAVQQAEMGSGLPQRMLVGIADVESGRPDPVTGHLHPWPWTINAEGQGSFFGSKAEAIAFTRQLQARGVQSIDVGCLQVNLMHHPNAFHSLEEAFDPIANARYAVRFLTELREKTGSWEMAAAWYHSANPELGNPYREKVMTAMAEEAKRPAYDGLPQNGYPTWPVAASSVGGMMAGRGRIIMLPRTASSTIMERPSAMVATATTAATTVANVGLGGVAGRVGTAAPPTGTMSTIGRGLASYRMQPVAIVKPHFMAAR